MANTFELSKEHLVQKALGQMNKHFSAEQEWTVRQQLALLCRMVYSTGHDTAGLSGQITLRGEKTGTYLTQAFGIGLDEVSASNLLLVDDDLNVIEGDGMPNPANRFHMWIYANRPTVNCIIHTHPFHVLALSLLEVPLEVSCMDSCVLYENVAFLADWPGIPVGNEEGELITKVLGDKKAVLLAHHGQLVATHSMYEAFVLAWQIERTAKLQLAAMAAGSIKTLDPELAREARDWILTPKRSKRTFEYYARKELRLDDSCLG